MTALPLDRYLPAPVKALEWPRSSAVVFLYRHNHIWGITGTVNHPNGSTSPVYRCAICTNVGYDPDQSLGGVNPDTGEANTTEPWWKEHPDLDVIGLIQPPWKEE